MFTLWDIKYEDEISKECLWKFDKADLDTGLSPRYEKAIKFRNKMNKISDMFFRKFKRIMKNTYNDLDVTRTVPYLKPNSYGDIPCVYFEGIIDGREIHGTICRPRFGAITLNNTDDEKLNNIVINQVIDDIIRINDLMSKYWSPRSGRKYSSIGYTCRENYFIKENK